jgi:polar amino acid transport system substrate-binding protein
MNQAYIQQRYSMKINFQHAHFALLAAWVTLLFLLSGCAVTAPSQVSTLVQEGAENTSLGKSELPENITSSGILRVGSQETYVPAEFTDEGSGEITGFTVDLLKEITRRLGLKLEYVHAEYAALIPGLDAGRFDIGSGGMSPNPDRLDVVDMVGYFQSGATFLIRQEDQGKYSSAQDFCGKPVGAIQGATTLEKAIHLQNEECLANPRSTCNSSPPLPTGYCRLNSIGLMPTCQILPRLCTSSSRIQKPMPPLGGITIW